MRSEAPHRVLGDDLPASIAAYYEAADTGRVDAAVGQLAAGVLVAIGPPGGHEVEPREIRRGHAEVRRWLEQRDHAAARHELLVCVREGPVCMVEGLLRNTGDGNPRRTFVASFRLDPGGLIERYLAYSCEPVAIPPRSDGRRMGHARQAVDAYFHALDEGRFEEAANQFSEDVVYNHPPYRHTGITSNDRVIFKGRDELLAAFRRRGKAEFSHRMLEFIQRGPNALFELVVEGLPDGGTGGAVCSLSLGDDGRIRRYVAFYSEAAVPQS